MVGFSDQPLFGGHTYSNQFQTQRVRFKMLAITNLR
jgi:hypothetical protein